MNRFLISALTCVAIASLGTAKGAASTCPSQIDNHRIGPTYEVAVVGDLGLVSNGSILEIHDLANLSALALGGKVKFPDVIIAVAASSFEDRLYVVDLGGVTAVDFNDFAQPKLLGRYPVAGELHAAATLDRLVYIADGDFGLRIIDFSDPAEPVELSSLASPGSAWDVAVAKPYVYLADFSGGLRVIDVSVPSAPVEVGLYRPSGAPYVLHVALEGDTAAITVWDGGGGSLRTLGLADPTAPQELGVYPLIDGPKALAVVGSTAYVAVDYYGGVHVVDISDPASPTFAGGTGGYPDDVAALAASERWLIAGVPSIGAVVFDRTGVSETRVGWIETVGPVISVAAEDGHIYAGGGGLRIIGETESDGLTELGSWEDVEDTRPVYGRVEAVTVAGNHAFLGWSATGLVVLDISQQATPVEVASVPSLLGLKDLTIAGDYLLVARAGLELLDVSQPTEPLAVASLALAGTTRIAVTGDTVVLAQRTLSGATEEALAVVDYSTPSAPVLVATLQLPCPPADVVAIDGFAFVGCATSGVLAVDLTAPSVPVVVGRLGEPAAINVSALAAANGYLYVLEGDEGAGAAGLRVVDIADPTAMRSLGVTATGGNARDLTLVGRKVAVAEGDRGLSLFDPTWCLRDLARNPSPLD